MEAVTDAPVLELAQPRAEVKLDLGCGQHPKEGFQGVDLNAPDAQHKVDLFKFPFPWADASVDEIYCSHFVEHLPARELEDRDLIGTQQVISENPYGAIKKIVTRETHARFLGQDFLFAFFDECYRILKPGTSMTVVVPTLKSNRAFQDPTHRRFIPAETFLYLSAEWRKQNGLDHYRVRCDFGVNVVPTVDDRMTLRHPEAQARMFEQCWNVMYDWHAQLIKKSNAI